MNIQELPSKYDSKAVEKKWYELWEKSGYFIPKPDSAKKPFVIVIPPPNVTGILHMGHALNNTIQDILIRFKRMQQIPALWVPGVDHAGIATQNVVEKKLAKEGKNRHQLGREKFLEEVWKWKNDHGSTIVKQLKRLGSSCDWSRERFTMDEGLSRAVREAFVSLYERGLIYRGHYIINWCPRCQTALSDEEAAHKEVQGGLYYIKYPIAGKGKQALQIGEDHIVVATTRPETMLGDTAVAVNPKDTRYQHLIGKKLILPLMEREIPVIADDFVDPEFGTGLVKVTPAHDPNDFAMGQRHQLPVLNILNNNGTINDQGGKYKGLDRFEARKKVVHDLEEQGLMVRRDSHLHAVGHCYRCDTVVEPYLSKQWFVKTKPLADKALQAQHEGKIKFTPERWEKVYTSWLENIRDWCISRQIWWGHQIPVWYCEKCADDGIVVSREDPKKCPKCGNEKLVRDPDVLDTWFSSWLWPFSTLGWPVTKASAGKPATKALADKPATKASADKPDQMNDLEYFYPTSVLVTAQEIIFFWVARMIMAGLEFRDEVPFNTVVIHGTVRVEGGQKMSKSLGNSIDPLEIIDEMGADALRFSLMMLAATDVYLSRQKFEMGRNFTNKIWNASRFALTNLSDFSAESAKKSLTELPLSSTDKWILAELDGAIREITRYLENHRLYDAANSIYHFFWHSFCDWYVELVKPVLLGKETPERKQAVQQVLIYVLETSLRLLHPFMPFLTEEIWHFLKNNFQLAQFNKESIMLSDWPATQNSFRFETEKNSVRLFQEVINAIRDLRSRLGLKPTDFLEEVQIVTKSKETDEAISEFHQQICFLARIHNIKLQSHIEKKSGMAGRVYAQMEIFAAGLSAEKLKEESEKVHKRIQELESLIKSIDDRLANSGFVAKAPADVIEKEKERKDNFQKELIAQRENLSLFQ